MPVTFVSNPTAIWDYYVSGFYPPVAGSSSSFGNVAKGAVFGAYSAKDDTQAVPRDVFQYNQGGGGYTEVMGWYQGINCLQMSTVGVAGVHGMSGIVLNPITTPGDLAAGMICPSWQRVQHFTWSMAQTDGGALDRNAGMLLIILGVAQSADVWPIAPSAAWVGGFGITADGAGNWNFESFAKDAPPATVIESVSLAANITAPEDWNTFDLVLISGTGSRPANMQLLVNGNLILERNWTAAPALSIADPSFFFTPVVRNATATGDVLYFGNYEFKMGRFLPDGRELLT